MCRQVVGNKKGYMTIDKEYGGLEHYLSWLIFERGGSGNGIVFVKDKRIIKFKKDINLSVEEIAEDLRKIDYDYALFHTRLATVGSVCRSNVHHFVFSPQFAFAMNGSENCSDFDQTDKRPDMTDAELIGRKLFESKESPKIFLDKHTKGGAYTGLCEGRPFVYTHNKDIMMLLKKDDAFLFSSDFPWQYFGKNIYSFTYDGVTYWEEGMDLPTSIRETFDANKLINGQYNSDRLQDAIKANPEYKKLLQRVLYQFDKEVDTAETIYALDRGIKQEDIDRSNTSVKTLFRI